ncbi:MAG: recombinase family protein [Firmicutes bacterium]|nr:recombinase family protein [Bacillota bacterium]
MEQAFARKVTIIPANPKFNFKASNTARKKRRGAYARVSTDSEEQLTSYKAQVNFYTEKLSSMEDTEFVGVYADEGLSGTSVKKRKEFLRMMDDCRAGKIDEIWVKSISRFSRNIVDCVSYIRELKDLGINIHFESINVDTLDPKGELLIIILASIAEEESRNISENIRWAREKAFAEGRVMVSTLYGYRKDEHRQLVIDPDKAVIVRRVFNKFLSGYSTSQIMDRLNADGIPTYHSEKRKKAGKDTKWTKAGVMRMLENEKYKGDAVLQKTYSPNFLSKRRVKNVGQAKVYFVENSHPPLVSRETYDMVQAEIKRRADLGADGERTTGRYTSRHTFSGLIKCGSCGEMLRRHGHNYKGEFIPLWLCKRRQLSKGARCKTHHIREAEIEQAFVRMLNRLIGDRDAFIAGLMEAASRIITDAEQADYGIKAAELSTARDEMLELNRASANHLITSAEYCEASLKLMDRIDALAAETKTITEHIAAKKTAKHRLREIRQALEGDMLTNFDATVFKQLISMVTVKSDRELEFAFICGIAVSENI